MMEDVFVIAMAYICRVLSTRLAAGLNSKIMAIKRRTCGYRNKDHFKIATYFICGKLDLYPC